MNGEGGGDGARGLSGAWSGRYDYGGAGDAVAFNAWLDDSGGALSGESVEPNSFARIPSDTLMAGLTGQRDGMQVRFTKRYSDIDQPPILYQGIVGARFDRIDGRWHFPDMAGLSGRFLMVREQKRKRSQAHKRDMERQR